MRSFSTDGQTDIDILLLLYKSAILIGIDRRSPVTNATHTHTHLRILYAFLLEEESKKEEVGEGEEMTHFTPRGIESRGERKGDITHFYTLEKKGEKKGVGVGF